MKNKHNKTLISALLIIGIASASPIQASENSRGLYIGLFGGGSSSDSNNFSLSGIAYKRPGDGQATANYDLLVNTNGATNSKAGFLGGLHVGYELSEIPMSNDWGLRPALELEGYYLGTKVAGNLANSQLEPAVWDGVVEESHSLAAGTHVFKNSFKLDMGVLLANAVFTLKTPWSNKITPYIGGGIGAAITSISGDSKQLYPAYEPTVNHFNSNPNATSSAFAVQAKAGVRAEIVEHLSLFAEYRYLNVSSTNYTLGSTVYPGSHSQTSNWNNHFGSMGFHSAAFGIEYNF